MEMDQVVLENQPEYITQAQNLLVFVSARNANGNTITRVPASLIIPVGQSNDVEADAII